MPLCAGPHVSAEQSGGVGMHAPPLHIIALPHTPHASAPPMPLCAGPHASPEQSGGSLVHWNAPLQLVPAPHVPQLPPPQPSSPHARPAQLHEAASFCTDPSLGVVASLGPASSGVVSATQPARGSHHSLAPHAPGVLA